MLNARVLNRTLLQRQHLLERVELAPLAMVDHLIGLQAQETLPPYLSLHARLDSFDPASVSHALETHEAIRVTAMRGTIHLLTPHDALTLRPWVQPAIDRQMKAADWRRGFPEERYAEVVEATREALAAGPLSVKALGEALTRTFPDATAGTLGNLAKTLVALAQLPPRGMWGRSGGVAYDLLERVAGGALVAPDPADLLRRYLRAFGPATPADFTTWSGVPAAKAIFDSLGDELVPLTDDAGKRLWDLDGLPLAGGDEPAPARLLGTYDNVWLSHAKRDRVTEGSMRVQWQGPNGAATMGVYLDGWMSGGWWRTDDNRVDLELFRKPTRAEQSDLDAEIGRVELLLSS